MKTTDKSENSQSDYLILIFISSIIYFFFEMAAIVDINIYDLSATILVPFPSTDLDEKGLISPGLGTDLKISCKAKGFPSLKIDWFKNGKLIEIIQKYRSEIHIKTANETSFLLLKNLTIADSGNYTCRAHNDNGNISKWLYVHVMNNSYNDSFSTTQASTGSCNKIKCLNGECIKDNDNTLICRCVIGYYGESCQHKIPSTDGFNISETCRGLITPKRATINNTNIFLCGLFILTFMLLLFIIMWMIRSRKHCRYFQRNSSEKETQVSSENLWDFDPKPFIYSFQDNNDIWLTTSESPIQNHSGNYFGKNTNKAYYSPFSKLKNSDHFYQCHLSKIQNSNSDYASAINQEVYSKPLIQIQPKCTQIFNNDFTMSHQPVDSRTEYLPSANLELLQIPSHHAKCPNVTSNNRPIPCTCQFPVTDFKLQTMV